jgi:hypothetical protein
MIVYSDPNDDSLVKTDLELLQAERTSSKKACTDNVLVLKGSCGDGNTATASLSSTGVIIVSADAFHNNVSTGAVTHTDGVDNNHPAASLLSAHTDSLLESSTEPPLLGLQLRFQLPSSTYATMLIRELTKESTSKDFQSALSTAGADEK